MPRPWKEVGRYGSVGIELVLVILILGGIGHWLDERYWGRHGWGAATGFLVGVGVGVRNLVRTAGRMQKDIERAEAQDPEGSRWTVDESWVHKSEARGVARTPDSEHTSAKSAKKDGNDLPN
ncbi:MAG: AtpZ/AtpI family protein [Myxococcota bacterium]|nr:AtpZ/AtpI family protein [Myxococcota bacterium]